MDKPISKIFVIETANTAEKIIKKQNVITINKVLDNVIFNTLFFFFSIKNDVIAKYEITEKTINKAIEKVK
ncbi:hypothetical protein [Gallibacterium anatis]|uniref:Uncharacterized protein n=1 Tax=Gallibacterium anatis TaxID=750 RepID=A0A0A2XSZ1_9PAST|nr:hypothetical protein [Gallibacterium anatis]KGQ34132.1 hypothetical protein JP32_01355 [Gallibacterium anatis]